MKKYIFTALALVMSLFVTTSCSDDAAYVLNNISLSSSYVAIPLEGGNTTITVKANGDWAIQADEATLAWLNISTMKGTAGETNVSFSAESAVDGRSAELKLVCGEETQFINVMQGLKGVTTATCKQIIDGPDKKTYKVTGVVTSIANTSYGNFYINDGTGEIYIYGTKDSGGNYNWAKFGIEVGDEVTVQGPKTTYNGTVELVDALWISTNKSLIKVDSVYNETLPIEGGIFEAYLITKGQGVSVEIPEDAKSWLSIYSIDQKGTNACVKFKATANEAGDRATTITFRTTDGKKDYTAQTGLAQKGAVAKVTCAEFNAKADGTAQYKVHGIITKIANAQYGNLYINDGTGEVYVYGITGWNADEYKVGDEVVLQSVKTSYKNAAQMKNAVVLEKVAHEVKTIAQLHELTDDKNTYFLVTGSVFEMTGDGYKFDLTTYGNFGLKDETGEIYVYGVADGLDGVTKNFAATGVQLNDKITILAYKTSYKGNNQIVGKFIKKEQ